MKLLLKISTASALLTVLAFARISYVHVHSLHTKDAILGEALDPLNMLAVLGLYGFGAITAFLLCAWFLAAPLYFLRRRRSHVHLPKSPT